jgi:hypothetical protein
MEHDPDTGEATSDEWVEVGPGGVVKTWAWIAEPRKQHPLRKPFAFALIQLDGADSALLHAVDAPAEAMATGMRVRARFADERAGHIEDIACFEPEA